MKKCYKYEKMFPKDLREILASNPVIFIPVSPIEWHGEHLAFECDAVCAQEVMKRTWQIYGGVLHPTLYLGTDGTIVENGELLWGMEMFAKERLPGSVFLPKQVFRDVIFHTLKFIERNGFKLAVIYTAHLAKPQVDVWEEIEEEFKNSEMKVLAFNGRKINYPEECRGENSNHAGVEETSELLAIDKTLVNLADAGIRNCDVKVDLKKEALLKSNKALGEKRLNFEVEVLIQKIKKIF